MTIEIYNSLSNEKEEFEPIEEGRVRMYVCGPTTYDYIHIGNARTFVSFDIIRRYLEYKGYGVKYVSNITDVGHLTSDEVGEDKIIKKAEEEEVTPEKIAEMYTEKYWEAIDKLNAKRPDKAPRATNHIRDMIKMIESLLEKGYAYEKNGSVYYKIKKFEDYGKLSGNEPEELEAGKSAEVRGEKRNPHDFALWKEAEPDHAMKWSSPWGTGYPGWHIECSVMSTKYLGNTLDIHGGGKDLKFPHHENEIAQSEAATGEKFVNYWMHTEFININGEKMAKSKGNYITALDAIEKWGGNALRYLMASSHYRSEIDFSDETIESAKNSLNKLKEFKSKLKFKLDMGEKPEGKYPKELERYRKGFIESMDNDFNTPGALESIFELVNDVNKKIENDDLDMKTLKGALGLFEELTSVLGIEIGLEEVPNEIKEKMEKRKELREEGDYEKADEIRSELREKGWEIEDTKEGPLVRKKYT